MTTKDGILIAIEIVKGRFRNGQSLQKEIIGALEKRAEAEGDPGSPNSWLIWSKDHGAWWGPNRCGYFTSVASAGRYTKAEADKICAGGGVPRAGSTGSGPWDWMVSEADALAKEVGQSGTPEPTWRDMYQNAIAAQQMTREAIEALGHAASLESPEAVLLRGPEPVHEGEAQCAAIGRYRAWAERHRARWMAGAEMGIAADRRAEAAEADRDALAVRVRVLQGALEPFAFISGEGDEDFPHTENVFVKFGRTQHYLLKLGDLRRAAAALSAGGADGADR